MKTVIRLVLVALVAVLAWFGGSRFGTPPRSTTIALTSAATRPAVWTCSMHPQVRLPGPGQCPLCFMDLIPLVAEEAGAPPRQLVMTPAGRALAAIATAPVERRYVAKEVRMVGKVDYAEARVSSITAWVPGRIERMFVDYTGVPVQAGDHMVVLYSPELLTAQLELQQAAARHAAEPGDRFSAALLAAARERLRNWGLTGEQIEAAERSEVPSDRITIHAPSGGIVVEKSGLEGMYVDVGTRIYTIADLNQVWVKLDAYESDVPWLRLGQSVEFATESWPGEVFTGRIAFIQPVLDEETRSIKVRVNVPNPAGRLKPGMFVRAEARARLAADGLVAESWLAGKWICPMHPDVVADVAGDCTQCGMPLATAESLGYVAGDGGAPPLVIPRTAPLLTGTRAVVYVEVPNAERPTYEGREVLLGPRAGDWYIVRAGLEEGERVVVEGNFKIDSALQIQARPSMMSVADPADVAGAGGAEHAERDPPIPAVDTTGAAEVPAEFRHDLVLPIAAYLELGEHLAADDASGAAAAAARTSAALATVDAAGLDPAAAAAWEHDRRSLSTATATLHQAGDSIEALRRGFLVLSEALPAVIRRYRPPVGELVQYHCPMAFDGRGAAWLQRGEEPQNPYFGAAMLRCGERTGILAAPPLPDRPDAPRAEWTATWRTVLDAYVDLQARLAADDGTGAAAAAGRLRDAVDGVRAELLEGATAAAWARHVPELARGAEAAAGGGADLTAVRAGFHVASDALIEVLRAAPGLAGVALVRWHCPMAFDGAGADWLQAGRPLANPYFGAAMLRCGREIEVFGPEER